MTLSDLKKKKKKSSHCPNFPVILTYITDEWATQECQKRLQKKTNWADFCMCLGKNIDCQKDKNIFFNQIWVNIWIF